MLDQTPGIIYLSEQRTVVQTAEYRSYRMFPADLDRPGFGALRHFDDDTLAGGSRQKGQIGAGAVLLILPLVGGVVFTTSRQEYPLEAGELLVFPAKQATDYTLFNPYPDEMVNYLIFSLEDASTSGMVAPRLIDFDLDASPEQLIPLWNGADGHLSIGKFGGRQEGRYTLRAPRHGLFVFVMAGAFEVENRLLEDRDALSLPEMKEIEFEALSQEGIILLLEVEK